MLKCKNINPYYLNFAIKSDFVQNGLKLRSLLTAIPMKINKDQIWEVDINYPINLEEQSNIGKIFDNIDTSTKIGRRDLTILTLLYDTAARASEIINLKVEDIHLEEKYIILIGKGNKQRIVPMMEQKKKLLIRYVEKKKKKNGYLFNINGKKISQYTLTKIINKYSKKINKQISPHTFRHTRAVHLLDKGVNIIYIQELLGHTSVNTTMEYAKVIEKSKFEAIKKVNPKMDNNLPDWNDDDDLLSQLLNL